jgi:hypothetical protein
MSLVIQGFQLLFRSRSPNATLEELLIFLELTDMIAQDTYRKSDKKISKIKLLKLFLKKK